MNTFVFFDDFMLWKYEGIRRRRFSPVNIPEGEFKRPQLAGNNLVWCPEIKKYRIFYSSIPDRAKDWGRISTFEESEDGINWHEPECGIEKAKQVPSASVMRDMFEEDPDKRYKCIYFDYKSPNDAQGYIATSRDGVNWIKDKRYKFCNHASDTENNIFYNSVIDEYQVIMRANHMDRRIVSIRSKDLIQWSKPELLMTPDPFDPDLSEYYGMVVHHLEGYFLGFLWCFYTDPNDFIGRKMAGKIDTILTYSYDGLHWHKASNTPLVERPMPPAFGSCCLYMGSLITDSNEKDWIMFGSGKSIDHACGFTPAYPDSKMPELAEKEGHSAGLIYKIRKEGFVGMESYGYKSHMTFKLIDLMGTDLFFNICAPCGWVKFQISEKPGVPISGFSFEDSITFTGDELLYKPAWKAHDIAELSGKQIRVELQMFSAIIFSLSGDIYPHHGVKPQKSLGDVRIDF